MFFDSQFGLYECIFSADATQMRTRVWREPLFIEDKPRTKKRGSIFAACFIISFAAALATLAVAFAYVVHNHEPSKQTDHKYHVMPRGILLCSNFGGAAQIKKYRCISALYNCGTRANMSLQDRNNVIALFFNSRDRINPASTSTDYTIALRKSMRNIAAVDISNVVIPATDTEINNNNNSFSGLIHVDDVDTSFIVVLTNGNYDAVGIAAEFQSKMNSNSMFTAYNMTWTATYDAPTNRIGISLLYPDGTNINTWGITFKYTQSLDVMGIGDISPAPKTFMTTLTDSLSINTLRPPLISKPLQYNITSAALSMGINTSYLQSIAKMFNVGSSNHMLAIDVEEKIAGAEFELPLGSGAATSFQFGRGVGISNDGNIIVAIGTNVGNEGWFARFRLSGGTFWEQRGDPIAIPSADTTSSIAISGDGSTVAVVGTVTDSMEPGLWVWTRQGFDWILRSGPLTPSDISGPMPMDSVSVSSDGTVIAVGAGGDTAGAGAAWIFVSDGAAQPSWSQSTLKLVGTGAIGISSQGAAISLSGDSLTLAVGGPDDDSSMGAVWIWTTPGAPFDTWTQQGNKIVPSSFVVGAPAIGRSVAVGGPSGDVLIIGGPLNTVDATPNVGTAWVWKRSADTWTENAILQGSFSSGSSQQGNSVSISADGLIASVGGAYNSLRTGGVWVYIDQEFFWLQSGPLIASDGAGFSLQGSSTALSSDGGVLVIGGPGDTVNGVEDSGAIWSWTHADLLTWVQVGAAMLPQGAEGVALQGTSVAINVDATLAAVGGPADNSGVGAVWIYSRTASSSQFVQQGSKLVPSDADGTCSFGSAVAMMSLQAGQAIQSTLVAGGPEDGSGAGAVWVFFQSDVGAAWNQQGNKLVGIGSVGPPLRGTSVAISDDGNTIAVGGPSDNGGIGAVWIWIRNGSGSGSTWTQQGAKLVGTGAVGVSSQGQSVALFSGADNTVLAVGAPEDDGGIGAVWVWVRSGSVWTQTSKLVGAGAIGTSRQGFSVAIHTLESKLESKLESLMLAAGAPTDDSGTGAVWTWSDSATGGTSWTQIAKLIGSGATGAASQGTSVSVLNNMFGYAGLSLAAGGPANNNNAGAVWFWILNEQGDVWTPIGLFESTVAPAPLALGTSVAFAGNVNSHCILIGAPAAKQDAGMAVCAMQGTYADSYTVTVPSGAYSIFDLMDILPDLLVLRAKPLLSLTPSFDGASIVSLTVNDNSGTALFRISPSSTFDIIQWSSGEFADEQLSEPVDLSLNNNVIGTIIDHSNDGFYIQKNASLAFRKYPAGFTLNANVPIDIQLRDERDRIVDLNGSEWAFTAFVTIHS